MCMCMDMDMDTDMDMHMHMFVHRLYVRARACTTGLSAEGGCSCRVHAIRRNSPNSQSEVGGQTRQTHPQV